MKGISEKLTRLGVRRKIRLALVQHDEVEKRKREGNRQGVTEQTRDRQAEYKGLRGQQHEHGHARVN
jgi:hypothetical protein